MLSKLIIGSAAIAVTSGQQVPEADALLSFRREKRSVLQKLTNSRHRMHPKVWAVTPSCKAVVDVLKAGPANIPKVIADGTAYTDDNFNGLNAIYWQDYIQKASTNSVQTWKDNFQGSVYYWKRWPSVFGSYTIFDKTNAISFADSLQRESGTCYVMSVLGSVAQHPDMVKDLFLTQEKNSAGIHGIKFYIRGKPWVIDIDDQLVFQKGPGGQADELVMANHSKGGAMWGPLIEKAWAKTLGNWANADGGVPMNSMRFIANTPAYYHIIDKEKAEDIWKLLDEATKADFIVNAGTAGDDDQTKNACGISQSHAYSVLKAFTMKDANEKSYNMVMIRNPWGQTAYKMDWSAKDTKWTDALVKQVPLGVDPRTSHEQTNGVFVTTVEQFAKCFESYQVGHVMKDYKDNWYDALDMDEEFHTYYFTAPNESEKKPFYLSVETYAANMIPPTCIKSDDVVQLSGSTAATPKLPLQVLNVLKWKDSAWHFVQKSVVLEEHHTPILFKEYEGGTPYAVDVQYKWYGSPHKDYTVKVHAQVDVKVYDVYARENMLHTDGKGPTEFTKSEFCGMSAGCTKNTVYDGTKPAAVTDQATLDARAAHYKTATQIKKSREWITKSIANGWTCSSDDHCKDGSLTETKCAQFYSTDDKSKTGKFCTTPALCGKKQKIGIQEMQSCCDKQCPDTLGGKIKTRTCTEEFQDADGKTKYLCGDGTMSDVKLDGSGTQTNADSTKKDEPPKDKKDCKKTTVDNKQVWKCADGKTYPIEQTKGKEGCEKIQKEGKWYWKCKDGTETPVEEQALKLKIPAAILLAVLTSSFF